MFLLIENTLREREGHIFVQLRCHCKSSPPSAQASCHSECLPYKSHWKEKLPSIASRFGYSCDMLSDLIFFPPRGDIESHPNTWRVKVIFGHLFSHFFLPFHGSFETGMLEWKTSVRHMEWSLSIRREDMSAKGLVT